jgi:hypothetical protein
LYKCETWSVTLIEKFWSSLCENSPLQWLRGPRHEMSSLSGSSGIVVSNHTQGMNVCLRLFCYPA